MNFFATIKSNHCIFKGIQPFKPKSRYIAKADKHILTTIKQNINKSFGSSPFRDNASKGAIRRIFTETFLLFLATAEGSNPAGN